MYCVPEKEISLLTYKDKYSTLQEIHPEWTSHELRLTSASELRSQFQADRETAARENLGLPMIEVPEATFTLTDEGTVWYPNYGSGVGLVELSERQKRLRPEHYSPEEHTISLLIEEQFKHGATEVVTSYGDRDVVIMKYDPKTKKGKTEVINTAVVMENEYKPMQEFISEHFPKLESVPVTKSIFLFADKKLIVEHATEIVQQMVRKSARIHQLPYAEKRQRIAITDQKQEYPYLPPFMSHDISKTHHEDMMPVVETQHYQRLDSKHVQQKEQTIERVKDLVHKDQQKQRIISSIEVSQKPVLVFQFSKKTDEYTKQIKPSVTVYMSDPIVENQIARHILKNDKIVPSMQLKENDPLPVFLEKPKQKDEQAITWDNRDLKETKEEPHIMVDARIKQNVVIEQTIEEYFETGDTKESIVKIEPAVIRSLYAPYMSEIPFFVDKRSGVISEIQKLCWICPLVETMDQPEMLEVEIPKDQNQRLYNLLHFLQKIVKKQFGEDHIRQRTIQVVNADESDRVRDEITYYLTLLEEKNMRMHMYAFVN